MSNRYTDKKAIHRTKAERIDLMAKIKSLRASGMSDHAACREVGVSSSTAGYWFRMEKKNKVEPVSQPSYQEPEKKKRKYTKKNTVNTPFMQNIPQAFPFTISGSPQEIAQFISAIARGVQQ